MSKFPKMGFYRKKSTLKISFSLNNGAKIHFFFIFAHGKVKNYYNSCAF